MPPPLLTRVAQGDPNAVAECVDRYGALVWSIARRFASDPDDAEDAVQEAFIELWRKAERYDAARSSEPTFVALVVRRRLIDRVRMRATHHRDQHLPEEFDAASDLSATEPVEVADEARRAAQALAELRPEERRVLELSIYQGLTHEQIARAVSMPLGTVKTHVRKGLARVRELLGVPALAKEAQA